MKPTLQLRFLLTAWLLGLVLSLWISLSTGLIVTTLVSLVWFFNRTFILWPLILMFAAVAYGSWYHQTFYASNLASAVGQTLTFKAKVIGEVKPRNKRQTVRLQLSHYQSYNQWKPLTAQLLWSNAPLPALSAGDEIEVKGVIANLTSFSTDFDIKAYYARWGIDKQLVRGTIITRPPPRVTTNQRWRNKAQNQLESHLSRPHLTVALGMLVGLKEKLPKHLDTAFKDSGLQHLLVVSGTNVTLLILALSLVLKPLGPWWRYSIGVVAIGTYLYLVGFEPPALRASLFGVITGLALTSGHFCEYRNVFLVVASLLCLYDPHFITHDVSFHLSFGATAGMLFGVPLVYPALKFVPWPKFRLLLAASFCAQMAVFPILITQFGSFPYIGLLTNLITEPLVPLIMFLSAGGVLIGNQFLLGLETLWGLILTTSIDGLIKLAQLGAMAPEVLIPVWIGVLWAVLLLAIATWAAFSTYYQSQFWEKLEAEIVNG